MEVSLYKIGQILDGKIIGDPSHIVTGIAPFEDAQEQHITFADNPVFLKQISLSSAGAILVPGTYDGCLGNLIRVKNPRLAFTKLIKLFNPEEKIVPGISTSSFIEKSAHLDSSVSIKALVYIGKKARIGKNSIINPGAVIDSNVIIGSNVIIYPNTTVMKNCIIGNNVTIHSGTVIGSDGFGFTSEEGRQRKIPHIGIVQIEDHVEIGACNTIDRATMGKTWIKRGVKTDNMVHIGHNVTIGENTLIVSNTAIAGSTVVGNNVILAGKAGVAGHLNIGDNARIGPKSGVVRHVAKGEIVSGSPAMPHNQWLRVQRTIQALPSMAKTINHLKEKIKLLEQKQDKFGKI